MDDVVDVVVRYGSVVGARWLWIVLGAVTGMILANVPERHLGRARAAVLVAAIIGGAALAWSELSLVDDAFVSLRYAENLVSGDGLVWNPGERVLGITNFGWTLALAAVHAATGVALPLVALGACAVGWLGFVAAADRLGVAASDRPPVLGAGALVALHLVAVSFASTGLETATAAGLVTLGGALAVRADSGRAAALAGAVFAAATLVRLDHGLWWAAAVFAVPWRWWPSLVAPGLAVAVQLGWAWWTYGDPLPNTFYAKGVEDWRLGQGALYAWVFWVGSHGVVLIPLAVWGLRSGGRFARYAVPGLILWHLYVAKIGGDFMLGRFLLVALPVVVVAADRAVAALAGGWRRTVAAGLLAATVGGVPMLAPREERWLLCDEGTVYPITRLSPLRIEHHSFDIGRELRAWFTDRDVDVVLAANGIGMVGFYSRQPLIDLLGLTDRRVARSGYRGDTRNRRPGHEKYASSRYLDRRGVTLSRVAPDPAFEEVTRLKPRASRSPLRDWHLYRYDPVLVEQIRRRVPEIRVTDGLSWARARVDQVDSMTPAEAAALLAFLDRWLFPDNPRPEWRERLARRAGADLRL
ncbi:MAG: hypothetical protein ABMB14_37315 [Myxococcota bacterium]